MIIMKQKYLTYSISQTKNLAKGLARKVLKISLRKKAIIIALEGELGSGKTTFLQGFAKGLGIEGKILSPTFVLIKKYQIPNTRYQFYHIDCYRIKKPEELLALGFKEIISNPQNIIAIEWADKIKKILSKNTIFLKFEFKDKNKRRIMISFNRFPVDVFGRRFFLS